MRLRRQVAAMLVTSVLVSLAQAPGTAGAAQSGTTAAPENALTERIALARAAASGEPVEVTGRRSERSTTRALPNGRLEVEEHTRPVRVRHKDGWVQPDATLVRAGGTIAPKASTAGLRISAGGDGPLVSMVRNGRRIEFSWPAKLPEPRLEGDTAIYPDVATGVDLRLQADTDGFAHVLEVKTAEAARSPLVARLALGLKTFGLSMRQGPGGELEAADAGGRRVFEAPVPLMWDSSGANSDGKTGRGKAPSGAGTGQKPSDGPGEGSKQAAVEVELGSGRMTLVPDQGLLSAADTRFPVFIDPVWKTTTASGWAMVSSGFPDQSYWKFAGKTTEGVGRCEVSKDSQCVRDQTKRVYYRMRMPSISGATVLDANFVGYQTDSYNCSDDRSVQLYRTSKLNYPATWDNRKGESLREYMTSRQVSYCSKAPVEFSSSTLRSHVASAASKSYKTITFMLKAYDETSMTWWKRFHEDAYLKIQYNHPPNQPKQSTMKSFHGGPCVDKPSAPWIKEPATMYATLSDPDTEDANKIRGEFTLGWATKADGSDWTTRWSSPKTDAKTSGSQFSVKMPSTMPKKTLISWQVRAWDGTQWGPWSWAGKQTGCYFYYDDSIPAAPTVTSAKYPADKASHGGVGDAGAFTISDEAKAASRYEVRLEDGTPLKVDTIDGAPRTVYLAPERVGPNLLTVQSFTRAEEHSDALTYEFNAEPGRSARARFTLDEQAGSSNVTGANTGDIDATVHGEGASLGAEGQSGTALKLNGWTGGGYAATAKPAVADLSKSFSVSVWARYDGDPSQYGAVLSQDSGEYAGLLMMYSPANKKWTFGRAIGGAWTTASSNDDAVTGKWTHLVGTYDATTRKFQVYVDGTAGTPSSAASERRDRAGPFNIGRSMWEGSQGRYWNGLIDDAHVYEHNLSAADAQRLAAKEAIPTVARARWSLDENAGASKVTGKAGDYKGTLAGSAQLGVEGVSAGAVRFGGDTKVGRFATAGPVVETGRSFSASAWVNLDNKDLSRYAVSQFGASESGFALGYEASTDQWAFRMRGKDEAGAPWVNAFSRKGVHANTWVHLIGVYDFDARQIRLYVNGELQAKTANTTPWNATGPLNIGTRQSDGSRGAYWYGLVDDVRVYDRIVTDDEAEALVVQHPQLAGRWKLNTDGADDSDNNRPLTLADGAKIDPGAGFAWDASVAGLLLNGTGAHASTTGAVADHRQSFTVAGWVRVPDETTGTTDAALTVFSQAGQNKDVFSLAYVPNSDPDIKGQWRAQMTSADTSSGATRTATHRSVNEGEWMHLAIVYNAMHRSLSLYANGKLDGSEEHVSEASNVWGFDASNGGLQAGRSKHGGTTGFWPDAIDDIWAYQGALTVAQLEQLAKPRELATEDGP